MTGKGWFDIKGFEGKYKIDKDGNVISLKRKYVTADRILPIKIGRGGYYQVSLNINNKQCSYYIHRLLALTFIRNPYNLACVNHIDGNKLNNNLNNLEWCTSKENAKHAHNKKLQIVPSGEYNHRFKYNILVYDLNDNFLFKLKGEKEIKENNFEPGNVYKCLAGNRKTHKKHKFKKEYI